MSSMERELEDTEMEDESSFGSSDEMSGFSSSDDDLGMDSVQAGLGVGSAEEETGNGGDGDLECRADAFTRVVDFLEKEFQTEEEALAAYKSFTKSRGFGVRKGDVGRINGVIVRRVFFCHREGLRRSKHYERPDRVREERLETRTDCKAKLRIHFDAEQKVWKVKEIVDDHNHAMAPALFRNLIPSHRTMSTGDKSQVDSLKKFGIPTSKVIAYMAGQSGGYGMLRFTKKDLYNCDSSHFT